MNQPLKSSAAVRYIPNFLKLSYGQVEEIWLDIPWEIRTEARHELFLNTRGTPYTYGSGNGQRTYFPLSQEHESPVLPLIDWIRARVQQKFLPDFETEGHAPAFEACFINGYKDKKQHLGWHADDSDLINHEHPIVVISLGETREIWYREKSPDNTGMIFTQTLQHGSAFIMPAGMQQTHEHRIPKNDKDPRPGFTDKRISLTFRSLK